MQNNPLMQNMMAGNVFIDMLLANRTDGVTRAEFTEKWEKYCEDMGYEIRMSRSTFIRVMDNLKALGFVFDLNRHNNRYTLRNAMLIRRNPIMGRMMNNLHEMYILNRFRSLGEAIQPYTVGLGQDYLTPFAEAIYSHSKLAVVYHPFDCEPYKAVLHPYCLKESRGRWYALAYKEDNGRGLKAQLFALDRMEEAELMADTYEVPDDIDPVTYFDNYFGVYVDPTKPVENIELSVRGWATDYIATLPLHHSQSPLIPREDGSFYVTLHMCITPDFVTELFGYSDCIKVLAPDHLREEMAETARRMMEKYR